MKVMIEVQQNLGQKAFGLILVVIGKRLNQDQMMHIIFWGKAGVSRTYFFSSI